MIRDTLLKRSEMHKKTWIWRMKRETTNSLLLDCICVSFRVEVMVLEMSLLQAAEDAQSKHHKNFEGFCIE